MLQSLSSGSHLLSQACTAVSKLLELGWREACLLLEQSAKVALMREPRLKRNLRQRHFALGQKLLSIFDAEPTDVVTRCAKEVPAKRSC